MERTEQEREEKTMRFLESLIKEWERLLKAHASTGVGMYAFDRARKDTLKSVGRLIGSKNAKIKEIIEKKNLEIYKLREKMQELK